MLQKALDTQAQFRDPSPSSGLGFGGPFNLLARIMTQLHRLEIHTVA